MDCTYYIFIVFFILQNIDSNSGSVSNKRNKDYEHECLRTCEYPPKPKTCEYVFLVKWANTMSAECFDCPFNQNDCFLDGCVTADGQAARQVIVTNGTMPGPSIQVCQWDTIRVKVINNLQDHAGLSIHWHGMYQTGTNWMDGASMITQCPIAASSSFLYEFLADPPGTHWWHGHSGFQRSDGLFGALIVRKPKEVEKIANEYDVDLPEHVILVTDWRNPAGLFVSLQLFSLSDYVSGDVTPTPLLINGRAMGKAYLGKDLNEHFTPGTSHEIVEGLRYRFRIVNSAYGFCNMYVFIEDHPLTVISLDGSDVKPTTVDSVVLAAGESYDFVMTANGTRSSYCMYFYGNPSSKCSGNGTVTLRYKDRPQDPTFTCDSIVPIEDLTDEGVFNLLDTQSLDPVDPAFHRVDAKFYIDLVFFLSDAYMDGASYRGVIHNQIDSVSFVFPPSPLLTPRPVNDTLCEANKYRSEYSHCAEETCKCTSLLKVELGQVVDFIIIGDGAGLTHSMHLHGHDFRVLSQVRLPSDHGKLSVDVVKHLDDQGKLLRLSPDKATVKDTVDVPTVGYAIIRWKADNPGYWFFHCHSEAHLETGMAMVVQVGDHDEIPMPPPNFPECGPWSIDE